VIDYGKEWSVGVQRVFSLTIITVLLSSAGCGETASTRKATHPLDGEWLVTSLNGKPLPADAEVTVVYHGECGCTSVDTHQNKELASVIDSSKVKPLFDQYRGDASSSGVDEVKLYQGSFEVQLKRIGPVRQRHAH
jgi:hypothetical protein